jgi:hypothetical protein
MRRFQNDSIAWRCLSVPRRAAITRETESLMVRHSTPRRSPAGKGQAMIVSPVFDPAGFTRRLWQLAPRSPADRGEGDAKALDPFASVGCELRRMV